MATATPKGSERAMAPILTSKVPNNKGISPKIGAGAEVGYHFVPAKKSESEIFSSGRTVPSKGSVRYCWGKKAIIPGSLPTSSLIFSGTYWFSVFPIWHSITVKKNWATNSSWLSWHRKCPWSFPVKDDLSHSPYSQQVHILLQLPDCWKDRMLL